MHMLGGKVGDFLQKGEQERQNSKCRTKEKGGQEHEEIGGDTVIRNVLMTDSIEEHEG